MSPIGIALLKKHISLGHAGIVDHSVDLSTPDLKKKKDLKKEEKKRNGQEQKKFFLLIFFIKA